MTKDKQDANSRKIVNDYFQWLESNHVMLPKIIVYGRYAGIMNYGFNHRIVVGALFDRNEFIDGWCYPTLARAKIAFDAWDGTGEPTGWHKHPATNRCRPGCDPARESIGWPIGVDPYEGVL